MKNKRMRGHAPTIAHAAAGRDCAQAVHASIIHAAENNIEFVRQL